MGTGLNPVLGTISGLCFIIVKWCLKRRKGDSIESPTVEAKDCIRS
jgi:hypothetical protein